ncbi:MotE family protein [Sphingomonas hylomeconis]|uniref:MotE family protein n=1 Tax=Sphingomonas hylomeconis TaxID=1395958 RepID=A0ABV7SR73_9SPHN|nr:hypothetical protein [Sphingomonas hylomeconis]
MILTAATAAVTAVANTVEAAAPPAPGAKSRLGVSIERDIAERDRTASTRRQALDLREQAVRAAEARVKAALDARAPAARAGPDGRAPAETPPPQFAELAGIYQAMKPAKAALVFEQLDLDVQVRVARQMRGRSTGMIMAAMTPKAATRLSMAMARGDGAGTPLLPAGAAR